ncbi:hydroxyacid dehydrogenase [Streptomyces litchfieldiae]|uniref:Hydroxyacid dehydrogenase n=1 Tax=Streptomyces litchfieldiae TaxID=3075543 RepID=A0ABU2MTU5_9ACTN|nr:hydroxyacid dehydrogenase [Streptomyces sp. DSM 44938]MDT0344258.1 hydroxyacid dehydrogenase [Streptomyces sp. DSM 44938]
MVADLPGRLFSPPQWTRLRKLADLHEGTVLTEFTSPGARAVLAETEVLITGWGSPRLDEAALAAAPRLRAVLHAAGSVKGHVCEETWRRGIRVSTAAGANAEPVAEYTLAMILLALKRVRAATARYVVRREFVDVLREFPGIGNHQRRVGLVGASRIGRRVAELLRPFSLDVALADPYLSRAEADRLGARLLPLDELLAESDLVSLHAPALPETHRMIDRRRLALLRDGAVLLNSARGWLVDEQALTDELVSGRIDAVLDVTEPEPLPADSPLYTLENVWLTPHLAGAQGVELYRLADVVLEELTHYAAGRPLAHEVAAGELARMA